MAPSALRLDTAVRGYMGFARKQTFLALRPGTTKGRGQQAGGHTISMADPPGQHPRCTKILISLGPAKCDRRSEKEPLSNRMKRTLLHMSAKA